eukprot:7201250-Pyramimonas_sp.AAC.1
MIHDLTLHLHAFGMRWKDSSLEYQVFGVPEPDTDSEGNIIREADLVVSLGPGSENMYRFRRVLDMHILGSLLS